MNGRKCLKMATKLAAREARSRRNGKKWLKMAKTLMVMV